MRRRKPAASTPAAALSLLVAVGVPCGRLRSHAAAAAFHQAASWSRSQAGRPARPCPRQTWRQAQVQEALRRATQRGRRLLIGRWWLHLSLPRRRAGWSILFLFRRWPRSQRYPKLHLRAVSSVSGSREGESCELCITGSLPSSSLARQQVVAQEHPSCPFVEPGKGGSTPGPASSRHTSGCHKPQAGFLCFLPHEEESGGTGSRSLVSAPWSVSVAPADHQTRLRDSVRPASPQVKGCPLHFSESCWYPCPVCGNRSPAKDAIEPVPPADMRSGFYSPYFIVPKKSGGLRPILDLRVLNRALHKLPFKMMTRKRIFGCVRPLDWFAAIDLKDVCSHDSILPRHRAFLQFAFEGRACQYKILPFGHLSQLGFQVNWGKSKLVPMQRISFLGMELDSVNQTARLTQYVLSRCWTASRLYQAGRRSHWNSFRGSWGIWLQLRRSSARSAPCETASALAPWPSPEVGVETRYSPGSDYTGLPQNLQPVDRSFVPSGRSAPGTGLQACCGIHGCLGHRLGSHVQRARSVRGMDGSPTALAYQIASSCW